MIARPLGVQTNNFAEYTAVLLALRRAHELGAEEVEIVLDSKLVVEQLSGRWKVRHPQIAPLVGQAMAELAGFRRWSLRHEPRAANHAADALANLALDDPAAAAAAEQGAALAPAPTSARRPAAPARELTALARELAVPARASKGRSAAELADFLDGLLDAAAFRVHEPENGLLVDGQRSVTLIGAAVNTSFAAIEAAAAAGCELLLVHHASWSYIDRSLHGPKMARLRQLGISLYCAHAALDCAPRIGTADALAGLLGIRVEGRFADYEGGLAGVHGPWSGTLDALAARAADVLGAAPEVQRSATACRRVAIVAGAGGLTAWLEEAQRLGCDTFVTGEGSMYTRLFAREGGLNLVLGGHYRTEAPGIRALAAELSERQEVPWYFVEDEAIG